MSRSLRRSCVLTRIATLAVVPVVAAGTFATTAAALQTGSADGAASAGPTFASTTQSFADGGYVVVTRDPGATSNPSTKAPEGKKFNAHRAEVQSYQRAQTAKHHAIAHEVGATVATDYTLGFSGFAATLTKEQAISLAGNKDVLLVAPDEVRHLDTWHTPTYLGLDGPNGLWQGLGGADKAGDGIVFGDIDSGAWPESASFAGAPVTATPQGPWALKNVDGVVSMNKADGGTFTGVCQTGDQWTAASCNSKLIAARYYPDTFLKQVPPAHRSPTEVISARDGGGHGTHTASTAVGNNGVPMSVDGVYFGKGSGMAPGAKLAVYKVCFDDDNPDTGGCYTSSTLSAIDDAIKDGVDVLNFSISGATTTVVDPVEVAFEGAAEAGIFVSTSAGNSGPGASTVAHNSPWLTTVANATHVAFENTLVLGDGTRIKGASIARDPLGSTPLVDSKTAAAAGVDVRQAELCYPGSLDPAKVSGKMVICTRGVNARVDKSAAVKQAGGVAMALVNVNPGSLDADFHSVPTVHVPDSAAAKVFSYVTTPGATASIALGDTTGGTPTPIPVINPSSSRGPSLANGSDLIKPDISAPGTSVLAAVAPPSNSGRSFDLYTGTSMSSPHIAGLAALYLGVHPDWSPMAVKSAMMTTAYDVKKADGTTETDPFAQGAGFVNPAAFLNPGLVVTSGPADWRGFLTAQGLDTGVPALAASDLNGPSIANGQVAGTFATTRVFTGLTTGKWAVKVSLPGFTAENRSALPITKVGQRQVLNLTFTRTTAPLGQWATGYLTLTGPTTVRLPIALRPVSVAVPAQVSGTGADGATSVALTPGFTGNLGIGTQGLAEGVGGSGSLTAGASKQYPVTVPAGTTFARFDLDVAQSDADFDLYLYRIANGKATLVKSSATSSADERIDYQDIPAGSYVVLVDGYDPGPNRSQADYAYNGFLLNPASALGNLTVTPNPVAVTQGTPTSVSASWSGLDPAKKYLGLLTFEGALTPTVVAIG